MGVNSDFLDERGMA